MEIRSLICALLALALPAYGQTRAVVVNTTTDRVVGLTTVKIPSGMTFQVESGGTFLAPSINGLTITTSTGTLTIPNGVTLTGPASSGTAMTLGNTETVTGIKTFGSAGAVGRLKIAGTTSGSTILDATAVASGTLTLPAATDTLVGRATSDALTGKTYNGLNITTSTGTLTVANGKTATFSNTLIFTGGDGTTISFPLSIANGGTGSNTEAQARSTLGFKTVYKSSATMRDSGNHSTTPSADPDLTFAVTSGDRWYFRFFIVVQAASATPDIECGINGPTATAVNFTIKAWLNNTLIGANAPLLTYNTGAVYALTGYAVFEIEGTADLSASGNIAFWWSPDVSTTDDLTVHAGSCLKAQKLN